ncbi:MAG: YraN family protein [Nitrospirae bacterium]|nr:YraN family protein [Nitrospirota bacterium]
MSLETRAFGRQCESEAALFLERRGYRIVDRNVRLRRGEIDLVAYDGDVLVFVEVKARRNARYGGTPWAVDAQKQRRLSHLALHYLTRERLHDRPCRFDLVLIEGGSDRSVKIELIRNAFEARGNFI